MPALFCVYFAFGMLIQETYQDMDDEALSTLFPSKDLNDNKYFLNCELSFEWYFDRAYYQYADFQYYQRLVLRNRNNVCNTWLDATISVVQCLTIIIVSISVC
jgi:hypothetical protein